MPYRILFITYTHSNGGGAENLLTTLVNNLDPHLYRIDIVEIQEFPVKKEPLNKEITLLHPFIKHNSRWTRKAIMYILYHNPEIIKNLFRLYNYDIIITWNYQLPSFCLRAFKKEAKIAYFHTDIYDLLTDKTNDFFNTLQLQAWSTADKIITISQKSLRSLQEILPSLYYKSQIIFNGCDLVRIRQLSLEEAFRGLPSSFSPNIVIGIGRLETRKNFQLLIRAVSKIIHTGVNCSLLLLGDGELREELDRLVIEEGITSHVYFSGYQNNPYPYIRAAKVLCVTSLSEGFPIAVMEAMTLGKPFVTTPVAGASEELADNQRCGLVSEWDVDEYSACIKRLLTDDNLYAAMSNNCATRAQDFSIDKYVKNFDGLINEVMQNRSIDQSKEPENHFNELRAMIYFSFSFVFLSHIFDDNLQAAYRRLKKHPGPVNTIKLMYRFSRDVLWLCIFPLTFIMSFVEIIKIRKNNEVEA
jgi:glycosyltransferase involved in cell wall biosynthesis